MEDGGDILGQKGDLGFGMTRAFLLPNIFQDGYTNVNLQMMIRKVGYRLHISYLQIVIQKVT